jgi:hypothetical protein
MNKLLPAALLATLAAAPCTAQTGHSPRVLGLPASVRAAGMGGAFPLDGGDANAVFYNPAAIDSTGGVGVEVARYGSAATVANLAGARGTGPSAFGFGLQVLSYTTSAFDVSQLAEDEASLAAKGPTAVSELAATAGYARSWRRFRLGVAGKFVQERLGSEQDVGWAADVGVTTKVRRLVAGLSAQDLGPSLRVGGEKARLPARITLDATLPGRPVGPLDVSAAAAVSRLAGGRMMPGGGVEVGYYPIEGRTFVGRAGVRRGDEGEAAVLTLGGGFVWDHLSLEYAFRGLDGPGAVHRVGISWH